GGGTWLRRGPLVSAPLGSLHGGRPQPRRHQAGTLPAPGLPRLRGAHRPVVAEPGEVAARSGDATGPRGDPPARVPSARPRPADTGPSRRHADRFDGTPPHRDAPPFAGAAGTLDRRGRRRPPRAP